MLKKYIWTYWHQGFHEAPKVVSLCIQQWHHMHPDWELNLLDQNNIYEYAQPLDIDVNILNKMTLAHRSDLLRTQLLIKYGGVWVDPTCFPLQKLEDWLPQYISSGIFFFYKPGRDRIISNWFIAAEQDNGLLKNLYQALINYWNSNNFKNLGRQDTSFEKLINHILNRNLVLPRLWFTPIFTKFLRIYPYMVYHFMLFHLMLKDNKIKQQFEKMPKFSAEQPHVLQRAGMMSPLSETIKTIIDNKQVPLFKLTWKIKQSKISQDSNLAYLFNQINKNEHTDKV